MLPQTNQKKKTMEKWRRPSYNFIGRGSAQTMKQGTSHHPGPYHGSQHQLIHIQQNANQMPGSQNISQAALQTHLREENQHQDPSSHKTYYHATMPTRSSGKKRSVTTIRTLNEKPSTAKHSASFWKMSKGKVSVLSPEPSKTKVHMLWDISKRWFLVDTGASVSIIPPTRTTNTLNNMPIKTYGQTTLSMDFGLSQQQSSTFHITDLAQQIFSANFFKKVISTSQLQPDHASPCLTRHCLLHKMREMNQTKTPSAYRSCQPEKEAAAKRKQ